METFKIGDVVKIKDGSWMKTIDENGNIVNKGKYKSTKIIGMCKDNFLVIAIYTTIPYGKPELLNKYNGFVLQNMENGEIWYATELNITKEEKQKYIVYWSEKWFKENSVLNSDDKTDLKIVDDAFFSKKNGFDNKNDIKKVNKLMNKGDSIYICNDELLIVKI